jgi:hypothetical protein
VNRSHRRNEKKKTFLQQYNSHTHTHWQQRVENHHSRTHTNVLRATNTNTITFG